MGSAHHDEEPARCIVTERSKAFKLRVTTLRLPLLVLFEQQRSDQAHDRGLVGEDPHDVDATLDLGVQALQGFGRANLQPVRCGESYVRSGTPSPPAGP